MFFSIAAVISDRCVDAVAAHGCQENHQRAEAIAEDANPAVALREVAYCVDGVLHVLGARVSVISPVQTKACCQSASEVTVRSTPGSCRQNRAGATARKPCSASSSQCLRMSAFTPNNSCRTMTAGAGTVFGLAI